MCPPPPPPPPLPAPPPLSSCVFAIKPSSGQKQLRHCLQRRRASARLLGVTLQLRGPSIWGPNGGPWPSLRRSPQRFPSPRLMATSGGGASLSVQQVYGPHCAVIGGSYFPSVAADLPFSPCLMAAGGAAFTWRHRAVITHSQIRREARARSHPQDTLRNTRLGACYAA